VHLGGTMGKPALRIALLSGLVVATAVLAVTGVQRWRAIVEERRVEQARLSALSAAQVAQQVAQRANDQLQRPTVTLSGEQIRAFRSTPAGSAPPPVEKPNVPRRRQVGAPPESQRAPQKESKPSTDLELRCAALAAHLPRGGFAIPPDCGLLLAHRISPDRMVVR
jgi:type II secretory pathway pseudopilin PulG